MRRIHSSAHSIRAGSVAVHRRASRRCCGCICCKRGSTSRTKASRMRSTTAMPCGRLWESTSARSKRGCNYVAAFSSFARREPSRRSHVCGNQRCLGSKRLHHARRNEFYAFSRNEAVLFVSHRLAYSYLMDEILVFRDGLLIEQGSHEVLLARPNSAYSKLWKGC